MKLSKLSPAFIPAMLREWIAHILTPAPRAVKALGYVREAIAIEERYRRVKAHWQPHLEECHKAILDAAQSLGKASRIMIIGSGGLHDVPVDELISQGHDLILVDIIHLPFVRRKYGTHSRITFIETDVTGMVHPLYEGLSLSKVAPPSLGQVDLIVSLNILSQLPLSLVKFAGRKGRNLPDDFESQIMESHLGWSRKISSNILLISDVERLYMQGERIVETEAALPPLVGFPAPEKIWHWHIAPVGEVDREVSICHRVGLWHL